MSRPRHTSFREGLLLLVLGSVTTMSISPLLLRDYTAPKYFYSFWGLVIACFIYPTCLLAFTRKNIARRNGDWFILAFVLLANYALFWLVSTQR